MKSIDKMSEQELRAEVRVLRAVFESVSEFLGYAQTAFCDYMPEEPGRQSLQALDEAIAAVEALDEKG